MEEFNPDTALDQFTVKKNQVQMMFDRGYDTENHITRTNDDIYLKMTNDEMIIKAYSYLTEGRYISELFNAYYFNGMTWTVVLYLELEKGTDESVSKPAIAKYTGGTIGKNIKEAGASVSDVIFIAPKKLNSFALEEVKDFSNFGFNVQVFTWIEMLSITPNHIYNGHSRIMPEKEKMEFVASVSRSKNPSDQRNYAISMPFFNASDPIPKYYNAKTDQLIITTTDVFTHNSVLRETEFVRRVV